MLLVSAHLFAHSLEREMSCMGGVLGPASTAFWVEPILETRSLAMTCRHKVFKAFAAVQTFGCWPIPQLYQNHSFNFSYVFDIFCRCLVATILMGQAKDWMNSQPRIRKSPFPGIGHHALHQLLHCHCFPADAACHGVGGGSQRSQLTVCSISSGRWHCVHTADWYLGISNWKAKSRWNRTHASKLLLGFSCYEWMNSTWGTLMLFWMSHRNLYSSQLLVKLSGLRCLSTWTCLFSHKAFTVEVSSSTDWAQQWAISYCKQHMAPLVLFSGDHFMKRNYLPETWRADFIGIDLNGVRRLKILDNI